MAMTKQWVEVDEAFKRLERHSVLRPTLAAMSRLVDRVKNDEAFADAHPTVSHATLVLSRGQERRRVMVGWSGDLVYRVAFLDPPLEIAESTLAPEDAVIDVLRTYFEQLGKG
jgi:hypothetical protein